MFQKAFEEARSFGFNCPELDDIKWEALRRILREMMRKYQKETCHQKFEDYVALSRMMWRQGYFK